MMQKYIWMLEDFPNFQFNKGYIERLLNHIKYRQGILRGLMVGNFSGNVTKEVLDILTEEIVRSSEIEGIRLDMHQVRSSVANHLGINFERDGGVQRDVEGIVAMTMDATVNYAKPLDDERLLGWHAAMFPGGYSGLVRIKVGEYRDDALGAMQIVSGAFGHERIHFQAPPAQHVPWMMKQLFDYINKSTEDDVIKAAVAHLWFVIIHPFEDGNGRIARAISEMLLCRGEGNSRHLYTLSGTINKLRKEYYGALEITLGETLDITSWVEWFLSALNQSLIEAENNLHKAAEKNAFWSKYSNVVFNSRQCKILEKLLAGFEGKLTSTKWAKICSCSHDTAGRDIASLIEAGIFERVGIGRATEYRLRDW